MFLTLVLENVISSIVKNLFQYPYFESFKIRFDLSLLLFSCGGQISLIYKCLNIKKGRIVQFRQHFQIRMKYVTHFRESVSGDHFCIYPIIHGLFDHRFDLVISVYYYLTTKLPPLICSYWFEFLFRFLQHYKRNILDYISICDNKDYIRAE